MKLLLEVHETCILAFTNGGIFISTRGIMHSEVSCLFSEPVGKDLWDSACKISFFPTPEKANMLDEYISLTESQSKYLTQLLPSIKSSSLCMANIALTMHYPILSPTSEKKPQNLLVFLVIFWIINLPVPTSYRGPYAYPSRAQKMCKEQVTDTLNKQHGMNTFIMCSTLSPLSAFLRQSHTLNAPIIEP